MVEAEEKVKLIQENLRAAQSRQKSYFDKRRKSLKFHVGDHVDLRVSPTKGVQCFGIKGKLAPQNIGLMRSLKNVDQWLIDCDFFATRRNPQCVPCISTQEMHPSSFGNYRIARYHSGTGPFICGTSYQDS